VKATGSKDSIYSYAYIGSLPVVGHVNEGRVLKRQRNNVSGMLRDPRKLPVESYKCMSPVYDEVRRRSIYENVQLFIGSKTDLLNVTRFKYSLRKKNK